MARTYVSDTEFASVVAKVSAAGGNQQEIANQLGIKVGSVANRLASWRKKGINVPAFTRGGGGRKLNVDAINNIFAG